MFFYLPGGRYVYVYTKCTHMSHVNHVLCGTLQLPTNPQIQRILAILERVNNHILSSRLQLVYLCQNKSSQHFSCHLSVNRCIQDREPKRSKRRNHASQEEKSTVGDDILGESHPEKFDNPKMNQPPSFSVQW